MELAPFKNQPFVSIIVPTFRRPDVLSVTLEALLKLDYPQSQHEIIVVDDGSDDNTSLVVEALQSDNVHLIYHKQENSGVATARNQGARLARGEILIFNDDDIIVQPDIIEKHLETMQEFGNCLVNGHWEFEPELATALQQSPFGRFRLEVEQWVKTGIKQSILSDHCTEPSGVTACNLGIRRKQFWHISGFDEQFPFAGCEDQDFSLRAQAAGFRFVYNNDIRLWHNDHRLSLKQFCLRQQRGAITTALLALKYPDLCATRPLVSENRSLQPDDSVKLKLKKLVKGVLATPCSILLLHGVVTITERCFPRNPLLPKLYWTMCGLYIMRGIRQGFKRFRHVVKPVERIA